MINYIIFMFTFIAFMMIVGIQEDITDCKREIKEIKESLEELSKKKYELNIEKEYISKKEWRWNHGED